MYFKAISSKAKKMGGSNWWIYLLGFAMLFFFFEKIMRRGVFAVTDLFGITKEKDSEGYKDSNKLAEDLLKKLGGSSLTEKDAKQIADKCETMLSQSWGFASNLDEEGFIELLSGHNNEGIKAIYLAHGTREYGRDYVFFNTRQTLDLIEACQANDSFNATELGKIKGLFSSAGIKPGDLKK